MKYFKASVLLFTVFFLTSSCTKAGGGTSSGNQGKTPSNLIITANVSVDGSGNVAFTAKADDAVSYAFEFGNGVVTTVASGIINYQYTLAGSNTYNVAVTANGSTGLTIKKTVRRVPEAPLWKCRTEKMPGAVMRRRSGQVHRRARTSARLKNGVY